MIGMVQYWCIDEISCITVMQFSPFAVWLRMMVLCWVFALKTRKAWDILKADRATMTLNVSFQEGFAFIYTSLVILSISYPVF